MNCPKCSTKANTGDIFCKNCGEKLKKEVEKHDEPIQEKKENKTFRTNKYLPLAICFGLFVLFIIVYAVYLNYGSEKELTKQRCLTECSSRFWSCEGQHIENCQNIGDGNALCNQQGKIACENNRYLCEANC